MKLPRELFRSAAACWLALDYSAAAAAALERVGRYEVFEAAFTASAAPANPYVELSAGAVIIRPDGAVWRIPLFWDGGATWKLRVSPDALGHWSYRIESRDTGMDGNPGRFECVESGSRGGLRVSRTRPGHFERQNGAPLWFLGDTAWGYFTDSEEDIHHRAQAEHYARTRAGQGFNAIHSMLLSEQGVGNTGGPPFEEIARERLNPGYWREVDQRLAFANRQGLTVGLALAWGDKRRVEPYAWRRFPGVEARRRYARYIAARYSAYDVYFLVSGEWHAEIRTREGATHEDIFREFVSIGEALAQADPHGRLIGIHPMSEHGSVREFRAAGWMSFGDYQQNYRNLHGRVLLSRYLRGPVVNSEYGYHLRDANGDGRPDKSNSYSAEDMRFSSWDIVMAGGYLVTGFGTTYFGGHRDPGPFDVDAKKNDDWEAQIGHLRKFFEGLAWWDFIPADELLSSAAPRSGDRTARDGSQEVRPPEAAYWALADPGKAYVIYVRGIGEPVQLELGARSRTYRISEFSPRTGELRDLGSQAVSGTYQYRPPDRRDWVVRLTAD